MDEGLLDRLADRIGVLVNFAFQACNFELSVNCLDIRGREQCVSRAEKPLLLQVPIGMER